MPDPKDLTRIEVQRGTQPLWVGSPDWTTLLEGSICNLRGRSRLAFMVTRAQTPENVPVAGLPGYILADSDVLISSVQSGLNFFYRTSVPNTGVYDCATAQTSAVWASTLRGNVAISAGQVDGFVLGAYELGPLLGMDLNLARYVLDHVRSELIKNPDLYGTEPWKVTFLPTDPFYTPPVLSCQGLRNVWTSYFGEVKPYEASYVSPVETGGGAGLEPVGALSDGKGKSYLPHIVMAAGVGAAIVLGYRLLK